ncbi:hypothetical protein [Mesorhizobium sp. ISC11]|uniref:hypothetical protein n=1 Tax=Mesorhizobium sp. ISC11 TaxID=3076428 RepID=UPI00301D5F1A
MDAAIAARNADAQMNRSLAISHRQAQNLIGAVELDTAIFECRRRSFPISLVCDAGASESLTTMLSRSLGSSDEHNELEGQDS